MSASDAENRSAPTGQKPLRVVTVEPPPPQLRSRRKARFAGPDEKKNRYHLPEGLDSSSPIGYRERIGLTRRQADQLLALLSLERPDAFQADAAPVREG